MRNWFKKPAEEPVLSEAQQKQMINLEKRAYYEMDLITAYIKPGKLRDKALETLGAFKGAYISALKHNFYEHKE